MTKTPEIKRVINPRTFTFVKYIFTIALIFFYTIPALGLIDSFGRIRLGSNTFLKLQILFIVMAEIILVIFIALKFSLHNRDGYKYNRREKNMITIFIVITILINILSVSYAVVELIISNEIIAQILFYVFEPIIFIMGIFGSIIEQQARINEQIFIYNQWYENLDDGEKQLENEIIKQKTKSRTTVKNNSDTQESNINAEIIIEKESKKKDNPFLDNEEKIND